MKTLSSQRYLRYLIWPGLAVMTAGLVVGLLNGWTLLPLGLVIGGLVLMAASLVLGGYHWGQFWRSRSTQSGTNAVVATLSVIAILGLINFVGARYDQRLDLTENQLYTLAPESQAVAKNLAQPVTVYVFDEALNPTDQELLESYRRYNADITYEVINPFQDPQTAQQFEISAPGEVYLQVGDKEIFVQRLGQERLSERDLTNKLDQLGETNSATVYFLQGHGEYPIDGSATGYAQAALALEDENFTVEALDLADTGVIPSDASAIVIAAPQQALFEPEQKLLENYLTAGGSVLLMVDPQVETGLEPLLADWGITLDDRLIVDTSGRGQIAGLGPAAPLVTAYGSHPITDDFNNGRSFYPVARPVLLEERPGVRATPLLITDPQTFAESISETGELDVNTEQAAGGPFNIGVVLDKPAIASVADAQEATSDSAADADAAAAEETPDVPVADNTAEGEDEDPADSPITPETAKRSDEARLAVIGNASFATDGLFDRQLNGDVFLNTVAWLSQVDNPTLSIRPRDATNRRIEMTVRQQILILTLALAVIPAVGIVGAGVAWWRRR
ncbi:MAG: Gldg family protein [Cyanobacteria bacterium J06628_6]